MFELRWLERKTGKTLMNEGGHYYDETVKILQYRNKQAVTDYSTMDPATGDFMRTTIWTDWREVPLFKEGGV